MFKFIFFWRGNINVIYFPESKDSIQKRLRLIRRERLRVDKKKCTKHLVEKVLSMKLATDPFIVFTSDDILPMEVFHAMRRSFPSSKFELTETDGYLNRSTLRLDQKVLQELILSEPAWEVFFSSVTSSEFLAALQRRLAPHLRKERGFKVYLPWILSMKKEPLSSFKRVLELFPSLTIDSLSKGATIPPHRDASRKLITIMFYFADDDWEKEWGGGTIFFRCKSKEAARIWRRTKWRHLNGVPKDKINKFYDLFEEYQKAEFKSNGLVGMCASQGSYHAVKPIQIDDTRSRRSVRLTLELEHSYTAYRRFVWRLRDWLDFGRYVN